MPGKGASQRDPPPQSDRNPTQRHEAGVSTSPLQLGKLRHRKARVYAPYHSTNKGPSQDLSLYGRDPNI